MSANTGTGTSSPVPYPYSPEVEVLFPPVESFRDPYPGIGEAVAKRTVLRKLSTEDGHVLDDLEVKAGKPYRHENWGELSRRVAIGNALLGRNLGYTDEQMQEEYRTLSKHIASGVTLMSGRHLQHGDETQPDRDMTVFTNCSTASTSFMLFYLLLNGSGVGRSYDDKLLQIDMKYSPTIQCVLAESHADFSYSEHESVREARHKYRGDNVVWFEVPDTREGWAKAVEIWEVMTFEKAFAGGTLVLDFSKVRPKGSPIRGMQNRPSSGPVPLMRALAKVDTVRNAGLKPWQQAMWVDHYLAECVLVGGARRSARMSVKHWRDDTVLDFIRIKRPIEFEGLTVEEVVERRAKATETGEPLSGFLWSSNNSVLVDDEFWRLVSLPGVSIEHQSPAAKHARAVFEAITECAYGDGTGEPGLINVHKLTGDNTGEKEFSDGHYVGSKKYEVEQDTALMLARIESRIKRAGYRYIVNPCSEIRLHLRGGFCVIADLVPFHADSLEEVEDALRATTRALIRVNTMDSVYRQEVQRTNRIGVSFTGLHEFAYKFFQLSWHDLVDEERSMVFWQTLNRFHKVVREEADRYSEKIGVNPPHTLTTIKPAGTTSKLFGLSEGCHLPAMREYLRWAQFRTGDPQIEQHREQGYPVRDLEHYGGTTIVGFPTALALTTLGMGDKLVTASEATMEEQYRWIQLLERYWLRGVDEKGKMLSERGNQISYTLKYDPAVVSLDEFRAQVLENQPTVHCCSMMPQVDMTSYEYQPEEPLTKAAYEELSRKVGRAVKAESVDFAHVDCASGACPVDFEETKAEEATAG